MSFINPRGTRARSPGPRRARRRVALGAEALEPRSLLSTVDANPFAGLAGIVAQPSVGNGSATVTNPNPTGTTPAQIKAAYGFDAVSDDGTGQTIAIVDAYNDPNLAGDVATFDQQFGLSPINLTTVSETGSTTNLPSSDPGWALEIALDVEWAHAIAPGANILLVEASSARLSDLLTAVSYARSQPGVSTISMSWGAPELFMNPFVERSYNSLFTTPPGHTGITFVAASGDDGGTHGPDWPAVSSNVLSVGGTSLPNISGGSSAGETAWSGSGGGISPFQPEPSYQRGVQQTGARVVPDVAYNADPNSGFAVYDSYTDQGQSGWFQVGGTSAGTPQWAALVSLADQALGADKSLDGATQTLPALYGAASNAFRNIGTGSNLVWLATPGYNPVTGLGSPLASGVLSALAPTHAASASAARAVAPGAAAVVTTAPPQTHAAPTVVTQASGTIIVAAAPVLSATPTPLLVTQFPSRTPPSTTESAIASPEGVAASQSSTPALPVQPLNPPSELSRFREHYHSRDQGDEPPAWRDLNVAPIRTWTAMPPLHVSIREGEPARDLEGAWQAWSTVFSNLLTEEVEASSVANPDRPLAPGDGSKEATPMESAMAAGLALAVWVAWEARAEGPDGRRRLSPAGRHTFETLE